MKKKFIRFAPRITSRYLLGNRSMGGVCYKEDAPLATEEQLIAKINTKIQAELATRATKEEIQTIQQQMVLLQGLPLEQLKELADKEKGAMALLTAQGLEMQRLQTTIQNQPKDLSTRAQVAAWQEKNKDSILKIRNGERGVSLPSMDLETRVVASPMTQVTVNAGTSPYIVKTDIESGVNDFIRAQPLFWDFLTKGRTNAETYGWVNKANAQGAAAFIGPGVAKPGVSFELVAEISHAKKIADSAKATTELLQDIDGMTTFIEQELRYQVMIKVNNTLMDSVGSTTVPTGIKQLSVAYTLATVKTTNPNAMDAIRAAVAQLRSGYLRGPIDIFINPIDAANMDLAKATTSGVYMLPPFVTSSGRTIAGASIHEDPAIPVGTLQGGFMQYYRILIYKPFSISWGWENDDFTRNLVTAIGEMRLHQFFNSIYTGAFIRDTFANIEAALL